MLSLKCIFMLNCVYYTFIRLSLADIMMPPCTLLLCLDGRCLFCLSQDLIFRKHYLSEDSFHIVSSPFLTCNDQFDVLLIGTGVCYAEISGVRPNETRDSIENMNFNRRNISAQKLQETTQYSIPSKSADI